MCRRWSLVHLFSGSLHRSVECRPFFYDDYFRAVRRTAGYNDPICEHVDELFADELSWQVCWGLEELLVFKVRVMVDGRWYVNCGFSGRDSGMSPELDYLMQFWPLSITAACGLSHGWSKIISLFKSGRTRKWSASVLKPVQLGLPRWKELIVVMGRFHGNVGESHNRASG